MDDNEEIPAFVSHTHAFVAFPLALAGGECRPDPWDGDGNGKRENIMKTGCHPPPLFIGGESGRGNPRRERTGGIDEWGAADPSEDFSILCVLVSTGYSEFKLSCKPEERNVRIFFIGIPLDGSLWRGAWPPRPPHPHTDEDEQRSVSCLHVHRSASLALFSSRGSVGSALEAVV
ncbi:hypothetical protein J2129_000479 [Methanofollis sp. W23]|nr:hypothetical protein [Methanofollis sp. W23]